MDILPTNNTGATNTTGTAPANLYAIQLKLRPLQEGTLMPFNGELVHAAWLDWLRSAAPDVATWLHEGNKRRLFTCSSLQWPYPAARMREAERNNVHLPLTPEKTYTVRVTLLLGELFPLFHQALTDFTQTQTAQTGGSLPGGKPPFMRLGKQSLLLEEVVIENGDTGGWTGFTSFAELAETAKTSRPGSSLKLEFASLTTMNRGNGKQKSGDNHYARLPLPQYIFPGLAKRWEELAPPDLAGLVQREYIERYIQDDGMFIIDYDLKPHSVKFTTHWQPGFTGTCTYHLRNIDSADIMDSTDETPAPQSPLTIRQQIALLARLAFYCGIGYKTAMGMGQTRVV